VAGKIAFLQDFATRTKIAVPVTLVYSGTILLLVAGVTGPQPDLWRGAVRLLVFFQCGFLLVAGTPGGAIAARVNAMVLVCVAIVAGGLTAAGAAVGLAGLVMVWLAVDHEAVRGGSVLRGWFTGLAAGAIAGGALAGVFFLLPPRAYRKAPPPPVVIDPARLAEVYVALLRAFAVLLVVVVAAVVILRWLMRRRGGAAESTRVGAALAVRRRPLAHAQETSSGGAMEGWRGRVVRLYLALLRQLARRGVLRRPDQTALEFARRLPDPAHDLAVVFGRARYGPSDVAEEDYRAAFRMAREVWNAVRTSPAASASDVRRAGADAGATRTGPPPGCS
jgi:hypothetical protein